MNATQRSPAGEESEVAVLDRDQKRTNDESHDEMHFRMQSGGEMDQWQRVFPDPLPEGYALKHRWVDKILVLKVVPIDGYTAPDRPDPAAPLLKMSVPDLITRGAELGVSLTVKMSKARMVSMILAAQKEQLPAAA